MKLDVFHQENSMVFETLVAGVREFNALHIGDEKSKPLLVVARDDADIIIGGMAGRTIYKQFLIEVLWIDENFRGKLLGSTVMHRGEQEAMKRGCLAAQVDTLSFQAPDFYKKLGFEVIGKVEGVSNSPDRYFLMKRYETTVE